MRRAKHRVATANPMKAKMEKEQEIEKHKVKKVHHRLIDSVALFEAKPKELSELRGSKIFV